MLKKQIKKYNKIINSKFGKNLKDKAWQGLVAKCPDWWQAKKVKSYDVEQLLLSPEERTSFLIMAATTGRNKNKKRTKFFPGETIYMRAAWKILDVPKSARERVKISGRGIENYHKEYQLTTQRSI